IGKGVRPKLPRGDAGLLREATSSLAPQHGRARRGVCVTFPGVSLVEAGDIPTLRPRFMNVSLSRQTCEARATLPSCPIAVSQAMWGHLVRAHGHRRREERMSKRGSAVAVHRKLLTLFAVSTVALGVSGAPGHAGQKPGGTATPIRHLVVIFQENVSFDHYFGTYPTATNPKGEPAFYALPGTPTVNGYSPALLNNNPNLNPANGAGATNPFRLDRSQAVTADQDHDYTAEQQAFDAGLMDLFPLFAGTAGPPPTGGGVLSTTGLNLGYYDGNTVTALWNYAQHFAMSDNLYGTTFGPSTPGALNVTAAQTYGTICGPPGASGAAINVSACPAPKGLNLTTPTKSNII